MTRWSDTLDRSELADRVTLAACHALDRYGASESAFHAAWYLRHRERLDAELPHLSAKARCGLFAALSPNTNVERNHVLAIDMAETGDCSHMSGLAIERARAIKEGADPDLVLGGPKVRAFYANLLDPLSDQGPVTIDRHSSAVLGWHNRELERAGAYPLAAWAHVAAASTHGMRPQEVQALTWRWQRDQKSNRRGLLHEYPHRERPNHPTTLAPTA